jgi:hypothetical protein
MRDAAKEIRGHEAFMQLLAGFRAALPDMRETAVARYRAR